MWPGTVELNPSSIYYDGKYNNLYFPGYRLTEEKTRRFDDAIYVYNVKSGNIKMFYEEKDMDISYSSLSSPYLIPGTDKIIIRMETRGSDRGTKLILKEREKSF